MCVCVSQVVQKWVGPHLVCLEAVLGMQGSIWDSKFGGEAIIDNAAGMEIEKSIIKSA